MNLLKRLLTWWAMFAALVGAALERASYRTHDMTEVRMR